MDRTRALLFCIGITVTGMGLAGTVLASEGDAGAVGFWIPKEPPRTQYRIDFSIELWKPIRTLGEHLKTMPVCLMHHIEHALDILEWYIFVEQITHRIDENRLRFLPLKREVKHLRLKR